VRALLRATFESDGYRVCEAPGARDGLAALAGETPDLVLLDVMMPEMDGWEMLQRIQRQHGRSVPVVMFSGTVEEAAAEAESRGASGFVGKPFDPAELLEQARRIVRH
jgi:CheY-like chemotaxis protein